MEYRKRKGKKYDTWHWREDCSQWPESDYKARDKTPTSGELCTLCRNKDKAEAAALAKLAAEELKP